MQEHGAVVFPNQFDRDEFIRRAAAAAAGRPVLPAMTADELFPVGTVVWLMFGNVNVSDATLGHLLGNGLWSDNTTLFDALWFETGQGALMVIQAMAWQAGLCGRPVSLSVPPFIVMAESDPVSVQARAALCLVLLSSFERSGSL